MSKTPNNETQRVPVNKTRSAAKVSKARTGSSFALRGQQCAAKRTGKAVQDAAVNELEHPDMKKISIKRRTSVKIGSRVSLARQAAKQELVAPGEWLGLLHNFENDSAASNTRKDAERPHNETATEELWERLSSTRWIKSRPVADEPTPSGE